RTPSGPKATAACSGACRRSSRSAAIGLPRLEAPPRLAEPALALAKAERGLRSDLVDESLAVALMKERAFANLEAPIAPVLRLVQAGNASEFRVVGERHGFAFDDEVETLVERVTTRNQAAVRVPREVAGLTLV